MFAKGLVALDTRVFRTLPVAAWPAIFLIGTLVAAQEQAAVRIERDVPVQMRDGVTLRADIYRPDAAGAPGKTTESASA